VRQRAAWQTALTAQLGCPELAGATELCVASDHAGAVHLVDLDAGGGHCASRAFNPAGAFA
jgi:hypothetical protein